MSQERSRKIVSGEILLAVLSLVALLFLASPAAWAGPVQTVRVGVPQDPPLAWIDEEQRVRGFFPEILESIARQEGWRIDYVPISWCQTGRRLLKGEIDILPGMYPQGDGGAFTLSRSPILVDWGQVYSSADSGIQTILDLEGKKVAVQTSCVFYEGDAGIRSLASKFNVNIDFVEFDDPADPLRDMQEGEIDAVVLGRFYNNMKEMGDDIVKTPILVSPVTLYFGAPRGQYHRFLQTIDSHIQAMKADRASVYYQSWEKWLNRSLGAELPTWLVHVAGTLATLALSLLGFSLFARYQVEKKTREISDKNGQLRSMSMELTLAEEKERRRLAELLHDNLGQNLALAKIRLATMEKPKDPEWCDQPLTEVKALLNEAIRSTRSLTNEVSPPALYNLSFLASLKWLTESILHTNRIDAEVVSNGLALDLAEDTKILLFKTVRELLVNVVKHARAGYVKIELQGDEEFLYLEVRDNGVGLPDDDLFGQDRRKTGFGLLNIRERLTYLGGEFTLGPCGEQGTRARLKIPMENSTGGSDS